VVKVLPQTLLGYRSWNLDINIHLGKRGSALCGKHPMGLHISNVDPMIGQKPTDFEDDPCMVYT